jgi:hypothetical protein
MKTKFQNLRRVVMMSRDLETLERERHQWTARFIHTPIHQSYTILVMSSSDWNEDDLAELLGGVLLGGDEDVAERQHIDGLDEDLVAYIAGLLSTQLQESSSSSGGSNLGNASDTSAEEEVLNESMVPFLDSVGCPGDLIEGAKNAILEHVRRRRAAAAVGAAGNGLYPPTEGGVGGARKLKQGIVNMSSTLSEQSGDADRYLWGSGTGDAAVKANANTQKDAYSDKSSAKDRRKQRQELERARRDLERINDQQNETSTKSGVSAMVLPTVRGKDMDVNVQDITLSLDNGTVLMDHGDLKFAYRRRYAIIGENGVVCQRKNSIMLLLCSRR